MKSKLDLFKKSMPQTGEHPKEQHLYSGIMKGALPWESACDRSECETHSITVGIEIEFELWCCYEGIVSRDTSAKLTTSAHTSYPYEAIESKWETCYKVSKSEWLSYKSGIDTQSSLIHKDKKRMVVARSWEQGEKGELSFSGGRVSVLKGKRVLEADVVMVVQQCECT